MTEIAIRQVPAEEARSLLPLLRQAQDFHHAALPRVFRDDETDADLGRFLDEWLAREGVVALAAVSEAGGILGCAVYEVEEVAAKPLIAARRNGMLRHLVVDAAWRGQGLGSRLVEEVKARLKADGVDRLRAHHYAFNEVSAAVLGKAGLSPLLVLVEGET
ncbi:GNAT family N-acetyltransferase [Limimaricola pyoseonensis]|uniref:Protein N-acetyltransferase, RimJ/RimL family n=1 Tax=Limimaricola pyoseonensis TaxID=521013 RepID=A0A1G7CSG4_9RHOB|nr:GNAT family N-acetyltransferase [Limimaricola pyoseonensis]SDE41586.1 Protein N-acetyltransferase, RimJ/RimL family [Limimaricola pyoseonensis]